MLRLKWYPELVNNEKSFLSFVNDKKLYILSLISDKMIPLHRVKCYCHD